MRLCYGLVVKHVYCIAASFFLSATALGQDTGVLAQLSTPTTLVQVVSALNVPAGAVDTANEMLGGESSRFASCLDGNGDGPWMFQVALRTNGRVRSATLISDGPPDGANEALASCLATSLRALRFRDLGTSIDVRVSRQLFAQAGHGFGGLGLRGTGRGGGGTGQGTIGLGNLGRIGMGTTRGMGTMRTVPRVRPGRAEVRGSLSREIIQRVIRRHRNEVRFCYERELSQNPALQGRTSIRFTISATGSVAAAAATNTTAGLESVAACISQAVRRWTFPAPSGGGIVIVTYPFVLSPG